MNNSASIYSDFKHTSCVCLILIVGMLPLWGAGYCMYVLFLLLPVVLINVRKYSGLCCLLILFSLCYTTTQILNGHHYTPSALIFDLLFPFIVCQAGQYVVNRQSNPKSTILLLVLMASALALPAIVQNITDAVTSGQLINVNRMVFVDSDAVSRAATGYGMMFALMDGSLGLLVVATLNRFDARLKLLLLILSGCAIFSTIHLINRTGLVLAAASLIAVAILPPYSFKKNMYLVSVLVISIAIGAYFFKDSAFLLDAMDFYEQRDLSADSSVASYGGRTDLWAAGFQQLFTEPLGNDRGVMIEGSSVYAHNMWLDAGAHGGILSFILLVIIGIVFIRSVYRMYKLSVLTQFERSVLLLFSIALFLQLNTEPVIEGVPQYFWYFIFFTSVLSSFNKKYRAL